MGTEIERKFLVTGNGWRTLAEGIDYRQGYLSTEKERTVRVRRIGSKGFLTVKGKNQGLTRLEYEYRIPVQDANELLDTLCLQPLIEKKRYTIEYKGYTWEVDEFFNENKGLIVAEIELSSEQESFVKPGWIGSEVSGDPRYFNSSLINKPFSVW